jgi:hypothetical protein
MLLHRRSRRPVARLRDALHDARDTYRLYSQPEPDGSEPVESEPVESNAVQPVPVESKRVQPVPLESERVQPAPAPSRPAQNGEPDVLLDVPKLHVDEIDLEVEELKARVALEARVLDLLRLDVGVDAYVRGVNLQVKGVDAQVLLKARLENLTTILGRVLTTIDRNPQIIERLTEDVGSALGGLEQTAASAVDDVAAGLRANGPKPNGDRKSSTG